LNTIDIIVGVVLLVSGVFALVRGFVHEILAIGGWILAALAALWAVFQVPKVHEIAHRFIEKDWLADVAAGAAIFLVVLIVASFFTHWVARHVQRSALGSADRALGFAFGLVRGMVFCALAYMVFVWLEPQPPDWFSQAKSMPIIIKCAQIIQSLVPERFAQIEAQAKDATTDQVKQAKDLKDMYDRLQSPAPKQQNGDDNGNAPPAYDQKGLGRLIENSNGK
jgi:membrane protein required for colicin V production